MKNLYKIIFSIIFISTIILSINIVHYFQIQKENEKYVEICKEKIENFGDPLKDTEDINDKFIGVINEPNSCFCRMYTRLLPRLLVYKVKHNKKELEFIRPTHNEYVVPTLILEKADAFISYGMGDDIDFEYVITELYKKNLYSYDCGIRSINLRNKYMFFESECIGLDDYVLREKGQISSEKIHSFGEKLKELKLEDKKIFLKMDIAGAELDVLPDIIKHHKNISGLSVVIRFYDSEKAIKVEKLLKAIEKNFVLVARNELLGKKYCSCNFKKDHIAPRISLTYINKEYVNEKHIPFKQSYHERNNYKQFHSPGFCLYEFKLDWKLTLSEKIKSLFGENQWKISTKLLYP